MVEKAEFTIEDMVFMVEVDNECPHSGCIKKAQACQKFCPIWPKSTNKTQIQSFHNLS